MPRVLIVDDDRFTRTVLETVFTQEKAFRDREVVVETAADGELALAAFRRERADVVITDLLMPRLDGFALCQAIRKEPKGDQVHLVVISAIYRDAAIAQRMRSEYRADFFAKPYQLRDMTERVGALLDEGSRAPRIVAAEPAAGLPGRGQLTERRLPAVLLDLLDERGNGALTVRRGGVTKTVELVVGHPVAIESSLRDETLGHYLLGVGAITEDQHRKALQRAAEAEARLGEALIALGLLTPEVLLEHLTGQMRHKLVSMLRWPDGSWEFAPNGGEAPSGPRGNPLDLVATVLLGLRDTANLAAAPDYMAELEGRPLHLTQRGHRLLPLVARHLGAEMAWDDGATLGTLAAREGADRAETYAVLDVLWMCGGLDAEARDESSRPGAGSDQFPTISVSELSEHSLAARAPADDDEVEDDDRLYTLLFEEGSAVLPGLQAGTEPIELSGVPEIGPDADSGVIDVRDIHAGGPPEGEAGVARRRVLQEYLRIQGLDHYGVLEVEPSAGPATISAAVVEKRQRFSLDWFARFDLGRDYAKLEEIHAGIDRAFQMLMDEDARAAYDRGTADEPIEAAAAPTLEAEIDFNEGEQALLAGNLELAMPKLRAAVEAAPKEAAYRAVLAWAVFLEGKRSPRAADEARVHLNQALALNPDHARAHEYKGIIGTELGSDDTEARFHLERALEADPSRTEALTALERIWSRRGEARPLERLYRRQIYRTAGRDSAHEASLWLKLADLYRNQLEDRESAQVAFASAARLKPDDVIAQAALADLESGGAERFYERSEMLRGHWRRDPASAGPGLELLRAAEQAGRTDAAFMTASALVARKLGSEATDELYQRYRPRFLQRAQRELVADLWDKIRHPDDSGDIGALFELIAPAMQAVSPLSLTDLEVDEGMRLEDGRLPEGFVKVRAYVAHMLGLPVPAVYVRSEFGRQIHVAAVDPPVLLAGDAALAAPERAELGFRLGRAMTYLWPGRAIAGSRPARFLRAAVLAAWAASDPSATVEDPDGAVGELRAAVKQLPPSTLRDVQGLVGQIIRRERTLNLSRWGRALARTADRVGLLFCGDLPAAVRFAADGGVGDAQDELIDFAISATHLSLRQQLGLSIDV